jgi:host factor-I protein
LIGVGIFFSLSIGGFVNRKLIRTTLADVKARREQAQQHRPNGTSPGMIQQRPGQQNQPGGGGGGGQRKRQPPVSETHAEIYYYKKQIDAHTPMVLVLENGEEIEGTIEWYDRGALKINRRSGPNLLVLKRHIKYIFKAEERMPQAQREERASEMTRIEDDDPHISEA